jgi:dephospho-CoA kinase
MKRVALTGGLATGKTFVREALERLGVPTFDADVSARAVAAPGTGVWQAIVNRFGDTVLGADGAIDRQKLADTVFGDRSARRELEAIVHPEVRRARDAWFAEIPEVTLGIAVAEIPLLYEVGLERDFHAVIVAACTAELQRTRAMARGGITATEARLRIEAQMPIEEKERRGDHVIRTDGTPEETMRQVDAVYRCLRS